MDLHMVSDNKYDLNLLAATIDENKYFIPKEK
jgi:hypothetical protein